MVPSTMAPTQADLADLVRSAPYKLSEYGRPIQGRSIELWHDVGNVEAVVLIQDARVASVSGESVSGGGAIQLQDQLRDLLCLAVVGDHLRWVLRGEQVEDLREWLADAVTEWRRCADQVAQFMITAGIPPDGRVRSLAADIPFNWVPDGWVGPENGAQMVANRLRRVADWTRARGSECSEDQERGLFDNIESCLQAQLAILSTGRK